YRNQKFFEIADIIIDNLSKYLGQELPQEEKIFLLQYLNSSRLFFKNTNKLNFSTEIIEITMEIINGVSTVSGIAFNIEQLKTELINHIKPLVNRVKNHIEITNKLLTDIQNEYSQIFVQVKQVVNEVFQEHFQQKLDDDEIGFITLYFAKFIEQNPPKIRVLIMCASGVGTSELLKVKVHKFFPELQIKDVISLRQYQKEKSFYDQQVDFIITTIFAEKVSIKPTLLVNAMFNKNDQINVNKMLKVLRENGK
ncbi:BglG family transcription antiterminator, partial [Liquorilactobacillus satsumensis]